MEPPLPEPPAWLFEIVLFLASVGTVTLIYLVGAWLLDHVHIS